LVKAFTEAMVRYAGIEPDALTVIIHDIPKNSWGNAGILSLDLHDEGDQAEVPV
jgi:4-oxalocrotonate tautomerase